MVASLLFAGIVATISAVIGVGILLIGLAAVYFRGYLIPKTPELTKRFLPGEVLFWFGKGPLDSSMGTNTLNEGTTSKEIVEPEQFLSEPVTERAAAIYREAMTENLIRGRAIETIAAGCLYAACRCDGYTRTLGEVAEVTRCNESKVKIGYQVLNQELGLEAEPRRPRAVVPRLASAVDASDDIERRARGLIQCAEAEGLANGRNARWDGIWSPSSLAATSGWPWSGP